MNKKGIIISVVVIVIIAGGLIWYFAGQNMSSPESANSEAPVNMPIIPATSTAPSAASTSAANPTAPGDITNQPAIAASSSAPAQTSAPAPQSFTVNGNDTTADLKTITVPKGTVVTITFGADAQGTYHGGLDFRSSVINTGTIAPGSTKTVTFTADHSFVFTPYWPATNIAKPYVISINVQ